MSEKKKKKKILVFMLNERAFISLNSQELHKRQCSL